MATKYTTTTLMVSIHIEGDNPVFGESVTYIRIEDDASGPYLVIKQLDENNSNGECRFDVEQLGIVYTEAKKLIAQFENVEGY